MSIGAWVSRERLGTLERFTIGVNKLQSSVNGEQEVQVVEDGGDWC